MKILQLITELTPGGAERVVADLSVGLTSSGHDLLAVSIKPEPANRAILDDLAAGGITVEFLNVTKYTPWRISRLGGVIKSFSPDIVHAHLIHANLLSRLFAEYDGFGLVNTVHTSERRSGKWWHFELDRRSLDPRLVQTAVSRAARDFHTAKLGVKPETMPVIYNGVPSVPKMSETEICELRAEWGVDRCGKIIGSVGRLSHEKGYDSLLKCLADLEKSVPENDKWGVVIIGEGDERRKLETMAATAPEKFIVKLPGFRKDAARAAQAFDLFVMPSRYEGFGLTLAEAMGAGLAVVASPVDSLPELLESYPNGTTVDFNDAAAAAKAIDTWIDRGPGKPTAEFSIDKMVEKYLSVYNETLNRKKING